MPGPVHMLYSVASDQTTARPVARLADSPSVRRPTILPARPPFAVAVVRSAVLRRAWHVCLWLGQALVVSVVVSAIMLAWIAFDGGFR